MGYDVLRDSATTIVDKFLPNLGSCLNHLDRSVELLRKHHNFATPNSVSANTHVTHVIECWSNHLDRSVELLRKHHNFATPNSVSANTHVTHVIECWSVMQTSQFIQFSVDGFLILDSDPQKS